MTKSTLLILPLSGFVFNALLVAQQIAPAGTLVQCTISEKISSQNTNTGDPVVCDVSRSAVFPYGSKLTGQFEDYKDPGHFVGKGWMELSFDRAVLGANKDNKVVPLSAKVVNVPGYRIDREGRILGKGHAVRDTIAWLVPVLWPIDLLTLPRRGPRATLKPETRLTIKLMEDLQIPEPRRELAAVQENRFTPRRTYEPVSYPPAPVAAPAASAPAYVFISTPPPPTFYMVLPPPPPMMWIPAYPMSSPYPYPPAAGWAAPPVYAPQSSYRPSSAQQQRSYPSVSAIRYSQNGPNSRQQPVDRGWHQVGAY